jgi:hypothetical protein
LIKIRYSELPAGLHASTKTEGQHTILYVLPGLSPGERRNAIDRLRASARVGHGPKLPAIPLALALIADRVGVTFRNAASAARLHPTGTAIPVIVLTAGAIMYALLVTVSVRLGLPVTSDLALTPLPAAVAPSTQRVPVSDHPGGPAHAAGPTSDPRPAGHARPAHQGRTGSGPSAGPTPSPSPTGGSSPTVSPAPPSSPSTSSPPSPSPPGTRGGGRGGSCLNLGLFRICV